MPRPKTKTELLDLSQKNFDRLFSFIDMLPQEDQENEFPKGTMNRNVRDVLAHLHHWHIMFQNWYEVGMKGNKPEMPAKGYTWKTTSDLNRKIFENYQNTHLDKVRELLQSSHQRVKQIIESHSNEELFEKKRYKWTGSTSLGAYLVSATSSHYDWGFKLIKKAKS